VARSALDRVAINRFFLPARRSAANPPAAVAAVDRWNGQTDGRQTDDACTVLYGVPMTNDKQVSRFVRTVCVASGVM